MLTNTLRHVGGNLEVGLVFITASRPIRAVDARTGADIPALRVEIVLYTKEIDTILSTKDIPG